MAGYDAICDLVKENCSSKLRGRKRGKPEVPRRREGEGKVKQGRGKTYTQ